MTGTVTVTAPSGPGFEATALLITGVTNLQFDFNAQVLSVFQGSQVETFELSPVTTVTCSVSGAGGTFAFTVS